MSNDWCGSYEEFDFGPVTELVDEIIEEPELTDDAPVGTYPQSVERFMNSNSSLLRGAASDHRGTSAHANHSLQSMAVSLPSMATFLPDTSSQVPTTSSRSMIQRLATYVHIDLILIIILRIRD